MSPLSPSRHGQGFAALVNDKGRIYHRLINDNVVMIYTFRVEPETVRFLPVSEEKVNVKTGYVNFELL
jgi:hypothetical protein